MLNNLFVHRGVGAMEIVAMDMKVSGMYIARQLSFSGVSFRIEEIGLDGDFKEVYNKAAKLVRKWQRLLYLDVLILFEKTDKNLNWEFASGICF